MSKNFLKTLPKWIKETMPTYLLAVLIGTVTTSTISTIKDLLEADNVNDFVYNATHPKKKTDSNLLLKSVKGLSATPFDYSSENYKYKCHVYLAIIHESYR